MGETNPTIRASFLLDDAGKPRGRSSGNYEIKISIDGYPRDAYAVTYRLDDTYYDPVREVHTIDDGFAETVTSYGNYPITARIRTTSYPVRLRRTLYDALKETHENDDEPSILRALKDIRDN